MEEEKQEESQGQTFFGSIRSPVFFCIRFFKINVGNKRKA